MQIMEPVPAEPPYASSPGGAMNVNSPLGVRHAKTLPRVKRELTAASHRCPAELSSPGRFRKESGGAELCLLRFHAQR